MLALAVAQASFSGEPPALGLLFAFAVAQALGQLTILSCAPFAPPICPTHQPHLNDYTTAQSGS